MLRSPLFRALAILAALAPLLAACDAAGDVPTSRLTAAERAALMEYLPEPGVEITPPVEAVVGLPQSEQAREPDCQLEEVQALREEPCWPQPPRDYALSFGGQYGSRFASAFHVIQDQTFRIAMDVRPHHVSTTQHLLASNAGLRFSILPNGAIRFRTPGYVNGDVGTWTLTTRPYAVHAGQWQRVEVSYNELLLRIAVDGQVKASTAIYQESGAAVIGPVTFAPSFSGYIDRPRFSTYEGVEVYEAAEFNEGGGVYARFTGLSGKNHRLTRATWVFRGYILHPDV